MNAEEKYKEVYDKYIETQEKFIELERSDYYLSLPESERIFHKNTMIDVIDRLKKELKDLEILSRIEQVENDSSTFKSGEELKKESLKLLDEICKKEKKD